MWNGSSAAQQRAKRWQTRVNSVEAGWYVIRPLHVRRESLSAFGAVTITPGGSGRPGIDRRGRVFLNVCLIRGNREEAATIACSAMDIFSRGGVYVLRDDREVRAASSDVSVAVWRDAVERLCIVTAIPENVEVARRTAADVAKLTDLPFGHPTLGPDATDPAMLPLDLPRDLCLSCRERNK